ncbi:MAG: ATP-dependent helicase [Candidatus Buchananbacteria bacterium]|nr:ATP-dependent helicase [Candidatus Buchananbacteria bacterium]
MSGRHIDYQKELNPEQYQVVTTADGPCLVLAGAGSGKTRTLVYRVAYLIEKGIRPQEILLVTFTNKASKEMLGRIEELIGTDPRGLWGGTFHHVSNRLLRRYGRAIGIEPNYTILDSDDSLSMIKSSLKELPTPTGLELPKPRLIQSVMSLALNTQVPLEQLLADRYGYLDRRIHQLIIAVAEKYAERKRAAQVLDYDDMLVFWLQLLQRSEETRRHLQQQFKYILVDEYQDTNHLQNAIITQLAGIEQNILVVGDDAQSIYSFRGAAVQNILAFPKKYPECKVFHLDQNYRSSPEILGLANASIAHNEKQYDKQLRANSESFMKPQLFACYDVYDQGQRVADKIEEVLARGHRPSAVAVLFRSHYQSLEMEIELGSRGIQYIVRGGMRFFEQAHVKDVISYLKVVANHHDHISWERLLQLEPGIGEVSAAKLASWAVSQSDLEQVISGMPPGSGKVLAGWQRAIRIVSVLNQGERTNPPSMIEQVLAAGYERHLSARYENFNDRLEDIKQLAAFSGRYATLEELLIDSALSEGFGHEADEGNRDVVVLSTIHQAKGLEWAVVLLIGLCDGQFPHSKVFERPEEMEEERRLFYVAVTRAKRELYLLYPKITRTDFYARPSQFLTELDPDLYDEDGKQSSGSSDEIRYEADEF